ncbi:hypothetical protein HAX54_040865 [Datura stramonium]|uniref:Uncharacterized protein n=1 Tax=Datura stramonium TaxID=4076 RepID=A0ABS8SKS1_DATST|nr:hypothetical protein [Datura stramonium]
MAEGRWKAEDLLMEVEGELLMLLCRYERKSVVRFLETFASYRVERCLHLCQEYGIVDAADFLLERVGDIRSALLLVISSLNEKFILLNTLLLQVTDILDILHTCIGLCRRNSPPIGP